MNVLAGRHAESDLFDRVRTVGLLLPGVSAATKYDGSPVLLVNGVFLAGMAMHASAEPGTLVVRAGSAEREGLLEDAPATFYLTAHYQRHAVVLVRLARVGAGDLRELLTMSWRIAAAKSGKPRKKKAVIG